MKPEHAHPLEKAAAMAAAIAADARELLATLRDRRPPSDGTPDPARTGYESDSKGAEGTSH